MTRTTKVNYIPNLSAFFLEFLIKSSGSLRNSVHRSKPSIKQRLFSSEASEHGTGKVIMHRFCFEAKDKHQIGILESKS